MGGVQEAVAVPAQQPGHGVEEQEPGLDGRILAPDTHREGLGESTRAAITGIIFGRMPISAGTPLVGTNLAPVPIHSPGLVKPSKRNSSTNNGPVSGKLPEKASEGRVRGSSGTTDTRAHYRRGGPQSRELGAAVRGARCRPQQQLGELQGSVQKVHPRSELPRMPERIYLSIPMPGISPVVFAQMIT